MLECDFCGCYSAKPGMGWAAYHRNDPGGVDESCVAVFCPPCAAAVYGLRPDVAAEHVCIWKPQPGSGRPHLVPGRSAGRSSDTSSRAAAAQSPEDVGDAPFTAQAPRPIAEHEAVREAVRPVEQAAEGAEGVSTTLLNMDSDEYALLEVAADLMKLERYCDGEWSFADVGSFTVTNKRIVFRGDEENIEFRLRSIVGVSGLSEDELAIHAAGRKTARFNFPRGAREIADRIAEASGS